MWSQIWNLGTFIFSGLLWPQQPRRLDGKPQILMWILMWEKGKNLVYLYVKLSILSIGGTRLIFINTTKCPTKLLIKKWDVVLSSRFVCSYSLSQYKREVLVCLFSTHYWYASRVELGDKRFLKNQLQLDGQQHFLIFCDICHTWASICISV